MRLWHYELIPFLPKSQLLAQWRELNSIFVKQDKHILINYVYEYSREHLFLYSIKVINEMHRRKINIKTYEPFHVYFGIDKRENLNFKGINTPFPKHHNERYLVQCFYNLQEKFDRGQKDFSKSEYDELKNFVGSAINKEQL